MLFCCEPYILLLINIYAGSSPMEISFGRLSIFNELMELL